MQKEYKNHNSPEPYVSAAAEIQRLSSIPVSWNWVPTCLVSWQLPGEHKQQAEKKKDIFFFPPVC